MHDTALRSMIATTVLCLCCCWACAANPRQQEDALALSSQCRERLVRQSSMQALAPPRQKHFAVLSMEEMEIPLTGLVLFHPQTPSVRVVAMNEWGCDDDKWRRCHFDQLRSFDN